MCTNYPGGKFNGQHNCTFPYNTSLTSVYISVTAGNAPYIAWTVAMEFLPKDQYVENPIENFWYYKIFEIPEPIPINEVTEADVKILQQIVPSGTKHSLTTLNRQDFKLAFCPDAGTTQRLVIHIFIHFVLSFLGIHSGGGGGHQEKGIYSPIAGWNHAVA